MRIGIFGGCFNPPHKMHKELALNLVKHNYLDKVIYVPTGNQYNKKGLIDGKDRLEMLKLLTNGYDNLDLSDYEINNISCTYKTLDYFRDFYKTAEIYFICGSDNLEELFTWKSYEYILKNYKLLVIRRGDIDTNSLLEKYGSSNIIITDIENKEISSTMVRELLKNGDDREVLNYLDEDILNYIKENNLY